MTAQTVVGLEIAQSHVRAVEVAPGATPRVVAWGEVPLPEGVAEDSEVIDAAALTLALDQLWVRSRISHKKVVLGLTSRRILVREYATPLTSRTAIMQSLPFEVQDVLPVPVDQAVLDFYAIDHVDSLVRGLVVAAIAEPIDELLRVLERSRIVAASVDLTAFALARIAPAVAAPGETVALLHIGEHTTTVTIVQDGVPRFVRTLPAEIPASAPVVIENEWIGAAVDDGATRAELRAGRTAVLAPADETPDLVQRVRSTLQFYAARSGAAPVERVLVSGAGSLHPGVLPALAAALDQSIDRVPIDRLAVFPGEPPEPRRAADFVSTIGLTIGGER
ncbi:MAG: hypothetical protein CMH36_14355 [Microbacterium sp.]|uniref:Competence protein A n=2 Tax=Bacteria TaxID=2 RepID=A0A0F0M1H5_9MICO|nr:MULTISPECIES: pilus assembly protein PilM [Microbacterium]MAL07989.1 hypothetical protein [Microbacterium sp.]MCK9920011.1 pilus assembly protein PilM [Microbacteriaceae bacterium K1510]KJL38174.1 Competence protein A [Microbacterium ginsengisoli]MBN9207345.1 pilus assembly protein PilM [Microbacterium ginsengisoli]HAN24550.1 hypothetical protein [Microbacterium ginsengisoli]